MRSTTHLLSAAGLTLILAVAASCTNEQRSAGGEGRTALAGTQRVSQQQLSAQARPDDELDLGDNWYRSPQQQTSGRASASSRTQGAQRTRSEQADPGASSWCIVLNTFSGESHGEAARGFLANLRGVAPQIADGSVIRTTANGSMVVYGSYSGPDDARARADLDRIKALSYQDLPIFPMAFLTRVGGAPAAEHPHSLSAVRKRYPNVDPLYTLQVAVWSDFDTGGISPQDVRRRAEAYAQELRLKGFEAYVHHGTSGMSSVTVGLFSRHDYDVQRGDLNPELTRLRRQFRVHLVNGEPLSELIDRHDPRKGTRVQEPRLVVVPRR